MDSFPAHYGFDFTQKVHNKPEGPTDPTNNRLPANFVVLVTGAGKGVGYQMALSFAKAGAKGIVISSRTQTDLDKLEAEIKSVKSDVHVLAQTCDTGKEEDVRRLAEATKKQFGRLDVAIANAGIISTYITKDGKPHQPTGIIEDPDFARIVQTNILGSYHTAKHLIPLLIETKDGAQAFVSITSVASHLSDSMICPLGYNLSKLYLNRMAESIHSDHHEKDGILAFAVHPGAVVTPQTENHHTTQMGELWTQLLVDDAALCGGFLTWLTKEKRPWLSGRYLSSNWDVQELEAKKGDIVQRDLLRFRMAV